jgi:hypothetical protein
MPPPIRARIIKLVDVCLYIRESGHFVGSIFRLIDLLFNNGSLLFGQAMGSIGIGPRARITPDNLYRSRKMLISGNARLI